MMAVNGRARAKRTLPCTAISTATMRRTKIATRRNVDDGGALHDDGGALHDDGGECAKMTDDVLDGDGDTTMDDDFFDEFLGLNNFSDDTFPMWDDWYDGNVGVNIAP